MVVYRLDQRLPSPIAISWYSVVAEALTNVAKQAHATQAIVTVTQSGTHLTLQISDDGIGGVDSTKGSGLRGLADRIAVIGGTLDIHSPPGRGTRLTSTSQVAPSPLRQDATIEATRSPTL